jgi:hypothetical protein
MGSLTGRDYAVSQDRNDPLAFTRDEFVIPTTAEILSKQLKNSGMYGTEA